MPAYLDCGQKAWEVSTGSSQFARLLNLTARRRGQFGLEVPLNCVHAFAVAAVGKIRLRGFNAWLFVRLLFLVGLRNKIAVFGQWVYNYLTYKRGARIIINLKG